jgi:hypothetical protein
MGEFGRSARGELPEDEASMRQHFEQVGDAVRHEREADRLAKEAPKRRWWRFWVKRVPGRRQPSDP